MSVLGGLASSLWLRILAIAERRLPALTRLRQPESLPILLNRRRIYVLPSMFGIGMATLLVIMQLGALNYSNNPALLLTCMLAAATWMSLFAGFRTLSGLALKGVTASECHAGGMMQLEFRFEGGERMRSGLRLNCADVSTAFCAPAHAEQRVLMAIPAQKRGWWRPGRIRAWTDYPLGMFVLWSWLNPDLAFLIFPQVEPSPPPLPGNPSHGQGVPAPGREGDYAGLRDYRSGDPQRQVAWKASARHGSLLVRETEGQVDENLCLSWNALAHLDHEHRIWRLAAWVLVADAAQLTYTLELGNAQIGPASGTAHRHACLRALALIPDAPE